MEPNQRHEPGAPTYAVRLSQHARRDVLEAADYISISASPDQARKWKNGLLEVLDSLTRMPARYAVAPESEELGAQIRHLPYFSHRILFRVQEASRTVQVLRIYHAARTPLRLDDLP